MRQLKTVVFFKTVRYGYRYCTVSFCYSTVNDVKYRRTNAKCNLRTVLYSVYATSWLHSMFFSVLRVFPLQTVLSTTVLSHSPSPITVVRVVCVPEIDGLTSLLFDLIVCITEVFILFFIIHSSYSISAENNQVVIIGRKIRLLQSNE